MSNVVNDRWGRLLALGIFAATGVLAGCSAADGGGTPSAEEVRTTEQAYDASSDKPSAAVVELPDNSDFVAAVNTNNELMVATVRPGATSVSWTRLDTGAQGVPTIARFDDGSLDMYVWKTDGPVLEYWRHAGDATFTIMSIEIEGTQVGASASPMIVEVGDTSDYGISLAFPGSSTGLTYPVYTLDWSLNTGWASNDVAHGESFVETSNSLTGIPVPIKSTRPNPIFGGRGWINNDSLGWFATRTAKAWGQPYEVMFFHSDLDLVFPSTGNPTVTRNQNAYTSNGSQILFEYDVYKPDTWVVASGCKAGGSIGETGWFRGSNGHLVHLDDLTHTCTDEGEGVASKPVMAINTGTKLVYFKGTAGTLWAHKWGTTQHFNTGLALN
jgi:hypothetical protein